MSEPLQRGIGLSLQLTPEGRTLLASVVPDPASAPIDEAWLQARIAECGCADWRQSPQAALVLLRQYNSGQAVAGLAIAERLDAQFTVSVAPDAMSATLTLIPAAGGRRVCREEVLAALQAQIIGGDILDAAIDQAISEGQACDLLIARGRAALDGADGWLESLIPEVRDRSPQVDSSGHIDYRDLGEILVVHPGDPLLRRHPPGEGEAGMTLLGAAIPAKAGKAAVFAPNLTGVAIAPDNPDLLLAAATGQPVKVKDGMNVEPVFAVEAVNMSSGNLNFDGSIVIRGDVAAGMTVKASGDIEVGGVVEAATLEAGGDIVIKGGAMGKLGHKEAGDLHLRCGRSFNAAYVQQVRVEAGDSIFIDDMAMQADLSAIQHIRVGNKKRGHVVGGRLQATLSITAKVLGSPSRVATRCEIGVDPALHKRQQDLGRERDALEKQLLEISKLMEFARHNPGRLTPEMLAKAKQTAQTLSEHIAAHRQEEEALAQRMDLARQAAVVAEQAIYEGVEVFLGNQRYRVAGEHGPSKVALGKHGPGLWALEDGKG